MNWLYNFLPESYVHALGWTVVHSLWQGTLIAAAMMLTMLGLQRQSAAMRYRMAFGSLVLMLLVAFSTFCFLFKKTTDTAENDLLQALILRGLASAETVGETSFFQRLGLFFNQNLSIIVAVWLSGVVFFSMRLVGGLWFIRQLQSSRQYVFLESEWQMRVNYFKNRLGIRQAVVLAESVLVNVPMVVGWLKPLILLPIGTANAMSTAQVEAILAHELAHVAARDFLLNIVQSFIEIIFFYHPAAWWISAIVRTERENRCDDVAVQLCGNSLVYAKALLSLQEMQTSNARTFGLAMTLAGKSGGKRNGLLLNRIKRILKQPQNRSNIMEKLTATGLLLAVVTALSFGSNHFSQQNVSKTGHSVSALVKTTENDTTPRRDRRNMTATVEDEIDGKKVELKMKNNQITQLRIDGKEIPEADFPKYADLTDELLDNVPPPPPAPPMPPTFNAPTPPTPPTPPTFNVPAPPMPPTPPTPPVAPRSKIKRYKDAQGNTILKLHRADGTIAEIKITPEKDIFVDGKQMKDGDDMRLDLGGNTEGWSLGNFDNFKFEMPDMNFKMPDMNFNFNLNDSMMHLWKDSLRTFKLDSNAKKRFFFYDNGSKVWENNARKMAEQWRMHGKDMAEQARRFADQNREMSDEQRRQLKEQMQTLKEKFRASKDYMRLQSGYKDWQSRLEAELRKDGFISGDKRKYKFEVKGKSLKINGKDVPTGLRDKYWNLYREQYGDAANNHFSLSIDDDK